MLRTISELSSILDDQIQGLSQKYQGFTLSVSGGADSTALFHVFCEKFKQKKNIFFSVLHINYELRGQDSDAEESFVRTLANEFSVRCEIRYPQRECGKAPVGGVQEWARNFRRSCYSEHQEKGILTVSAHHRDDLIETILLRMIRGASLGALRGMKEFSGDHWRPFLQIPKRELIAYLQGINRSNCCDQSNDKIEYRRNFLRHEIIPRLEEIHHGAGGRILAVSEEASELVAYNRRLLVDQLENRSFSPEVEFFASLPKVVCFMCVELMCKKAGSSERTSKLSRRKLTLIYEKLNKQEKNWQIDLAKGLKFELKNGISKVIFMKPATTLLLRSQEGEGI